MRTMKVTLAFQKADYGKLKPNKYEQLIKWWTKSDYYHVELIIDDMWISSLDYRGFRMSKLRPLNDLYDYHSMDVTVTDIQYSNLIDWLNSQVDKKYDWYGLVMSQVLKIGLDHTDKWICSEVVTKILQLMLVKEVYDLVPIMTSPGDLARVFKVNKRKI